MPSILLVASIFVSSTMTFQLNSELFPGVKNIIFDLGGVLLNIDYFLTERAFQSIGVANFGEAYSQAKQSSLFDALETGKLSPAQFRDQVRTLMAPELGDAEIDQAWNAMLLDLPLNRVELIKGLHGNYRTFLLSNTNQIHYDAYSKYLKQAHGFLDFSEIMEKQYLSFTLGLRKPDLACFRHVVEENGLKPAETLFIDDSIQHVQGAKQIGLQTYHLRVLEGERVENLFLPSKF